MLTRSPSPRSHIILQVHIKKVNGGSRHWQSFSLSQTESLPWHNSAHAKLHITVLPTPQISLFFSFSKYFLFSWPLSGWTLSWINSNIWNSATHTRRGIIRPQQFCRKGQTHLLLKWKVTIAKCQMELGKEKNGLPCVCPLRPSVCAQSCPPLITYQPLTARPTERREPLRPTSIAPQNH